MVIVDSNGGGADVTGMTSGVPGVLGGAEDVASGSMISVGISACCGYLSYGISRCAGLVGAFGGVA